jgi:hypothetical protein
MLHLEFKKASHKTLMPQGYGKGQKKKTTTNKGLATKPVQD